MQAAVHIPAYSRVLTALSFVIAGFQPHWDDFFRKIQPIAARTFYMVVPGNHEFWQNFTAYKARFGMPREAETDNMYYSFTAGPVHFVMMDTESVLDTADVDATQVAWIQGDLAAVNRSVTPWVVASGHRPLYCSDNDKTQCGIFSDVLRFQVEQTLYSNGVDLVLGAHEHGYERMFPTYNGAATSTNYNSPTAPVYVVNGAAGNREGNENPAGNQPWSAAHSGAIGYAYIQVSSATALTYSFFGSANGTEIDTFTITK